MLSLFEKNSILHGSNLARESRREALHRAQTDIFFVDIRMMLVNPATRKWLLGELEDRPQNLDQLALRICKFVIASLRGYPNLRMIIFAAEIEAWCSAHRQSRMAATNFATSSGAGSEWRAQRHTVFFENRRNRLVGDQFGDERVEAVADMPHSGTKPAARPTRLSVAARA